MRSNAEVPVRAAVASAPDLVFSGRAQQCRPGVGESRWPLGGPAFDGVPGARQGANYAAARVRRRPGPPVKPTHQQIGQRQQRRPAVNRRSVEQQCAAFVGIVLTRRAQPLVDQGRRTIGHRAQAFPGHRAERMASRLGLHGREEPDFGDEAVVIRGELTADAGRESVPDELSFEQPCGLTPPALAVREPREGATCDKLPGRLNDHVVASR